ncbi:hypothetical protein Vadar_028214 [Vaccinium darrowii]|uniref:Uncharacterized protein n=1 Tax=Vaccinium darrowii TaxID=229202 RepID=A0ACB7Z7N6_9ERIC|nr:hypothetical protein Vadar_028214 [Vaccinium darrowii]
MEVTARKRWIARGQRWRKGFGAQSLIDVPDVDVLKRRSEEVLAGAIEGDARINGCNHPERRSRLVPEVRLQIIVLLWGDLIQIGFFALI